jgi:hypothetical protein
LGKAWEKKLYGIWIYLILKEEIQLNFFIEQLLIKLNFDQDELYHFQICTKILIFFRAYEIKYVSYKFWSRCQL